MNVCIIIPVFNQENRIGPVVQAAQKHLLDIIVIDDGSTDNTAHSANKAGALVLRHATNRGKGAALRTGFQYACTHHFDAVITMDGDGQHIADDIRTILAVRPLPDIIIGSRMFCPKNMPLLMKGTNKLLSGFISLLSGAAITDTQSGFRFIKISVLATIPLHTKGYETETELLIKALRSGYTCQEVPIQTIYHTRVPRASVVYDFLNFLKLFASPYLYFTKRTRDDKAST